MPPLSLIQEAAGSVPICFGQTSGQTANNRPAHYHRQKKLSEMPAIAFHRRTDVFSRHKSKQKCRYQQEKNEKSASKLIIALTLGIFVHRACSSRRLMPEASD